MHVVRRILNQVTCCRHDGGSIQHGVTIGGGALDLQGGKTLDEQIADLYAEDQRQAATEEQDIQTRLREAMQREEEQRKLDRINSAFQQNKYDYNGKLYKIKE